MQIEFNKKQYKQLIKYLETASSVFGILGDFIGKKYKKESNELEELRDYLLKRAKDFKCGRITEEFEGETILKDKYAEKFMKIIDDYDDYIFWSELVQRLAQKDFFKKYIKEEIKKMDTMERITKFNELEKEYWKEFEKNGTEKVVVRK